MEALRCDDLSLCGMAYNLAHVHAAESMVTCDIATVDLLGFIHRSFSLFCFNGSDGQASSGLSRLLGGPHHPSA